MADQAPHLGSGPSTGRGASGSQRPGEGNENTGDPNSSAAPGPAAEGAPIKKRRNHRAGKKKKNIRRQSFAPVDIPSNIDGTRSHHDLLASQTSAASRPGLYQLGQSGRNLSDVSLDSHALLDHRDHPPLRARRDSRASQGFFAARPSQAGQEANASFRPSYANPFVSNDGNHRLRRNRMQKSSGADSEGDDGVLPDSQTPLLGSSNRDRPTSGKASGYGMISALARESGLTRRPSNGTSSSSKKLRRTLTQDFAFAGTPNDYNVNNPPSVPNSPKLGPEMGYDDVLVTGSFTPRPADLDRRATMPQVGDLLIDIDGDANAGPNSSPPTPRRSSAENRRRFLAPTAEEDVCFPLEGMSELADEDFNGQHSHYEAGPRRRRGRQWPDLSVLDDWSREEKEERIDGIRAKKIDEPVLVGGRLRPQKNGWHRAEEDAPYRFTYFNEEFQSTIHSQTISELLQPGQTFKDLFIPEPPELSDCSSDEEEVFSHQDTATERAELSPGGQSRSSTRHPSLMEESKKDSRESSGEATPAKSQLTQPQETHKRFGARPTFWLDVLSPTDTEMRVISKTFGVHPLTAEDIMMQEAREKVELFRNYYFVNYRTFEQDMNSEDYLEPVNMYVVVFREGVISFHFSMTPHPANVRRRIRQLKDYLILSSDWISYAVIDDITDVFAPLITSVEDEVDEIDDAILQLHSGNDTSAAKTNNASKDLEKTSEAGEQNSTESGGDMLRRVGQARKKVMGLYRLLGNKADVIKGFAKRCNEQWEIAPRSEIGLYLGDIQDHILTMTSNLGHYETLLSRAHSNYLAQINIRMNERQEQTADVLGKLTVLGTIVLPMNIITGMWGMNVLVPGQDSENLYWFWSITAGLLVFGISCFFIAKRVYGIV